MIITGVRRYGAPAAAHCIPLDGLLGRSAFISGTVPEASATEFLLHTGSLLSITGSGICARCRRSAHKPGCFWLLNGEFFFVASLQLTDVEQFSLELPIAVVAICVVVSFGTDLRSCSACLSSETDRS